MSNMDDQSPMEVQPPPGINPAASPVVDPAAPGQPPESSQTRSDYVPERGSAAAVDPSTRSAVATRVAPRPMRGVSAGGRREGRSSRSPARGRAAAMSVPAGVATHVQLLQAQVNQLTDRLTKLEKSHEEGQEAITLRKSG